MGVHHRAISLSSGEGARVREYYSRAEIQSFLKEAMASPETMKLIARKAKRAFSSFRTASVFDIEELINEAFLRSWHGRNESYHKDRSFLDSFLAVVNSIRGDWTDALWVRRNRNDRIDDWPKIADDQPDAERELIARERCQQVHLEFQDDRVAQAMLTCWLEGLTKDEVCERLKLTATEYDSKCRKIRRRLNARFPGGWDF